MTSPHGIDLILGADSIRPPLTGIGRYALELARRLPGAPGVGRVRFYGLGQWLGWLWPYVTLAYVVIRLSRRQQPA